MYLLCTLLMMNYYLFSLSKKVFTFTGIEFSVNIFFCVSTFKNVALLFSRIISDEKSASKCLFFFLFGLYLRNFYWY